MKKCFKCLCVKPLSEFYAHKAMKDGHLNKCKACTLADVSAHRIQNLERIRAYDRARGRTAPRLKKSRQYVECRKGTPEYELRRKARVALGNAVKYKRIQPWPCEVCGKEKAQAHHPDYTRPLLVTWLCTTHHGQAHKETNDAMRQAA
jgi:hypothetical protein